MAPKKQQPQIPVPSFQDDSDIYESWRKDVERWCLLSNLTPAKKALQIHFSLTGKAKIASHQIPTDELTIKSLLEKLDEIYMPDKVHRIVNIFHEMYSLKKDPDMNINEYICEFQQKYYRFQEVDGELPDKVLACMLLSSCQLSEDKNQIVKTGLPSDFKMADMVSTLKRVFGNENRAGQSTMSQSEPAPQVFYTEDQNKTEDTLYTSRSKEYGNYGNQGRFPYRGSSRGRGRRRFGRSAYRNRSSGRNRTNPLNRDGEVTSCIICNSIYHYAKFCPNAPNRDNDNYEKNKNRTINWCMFIGCASSDQNTKLEDLIEETDGHGILDSGCSNTVCGERWLAKFTEKLSDEERQEMKLESSDQSFTFGDGRIVNSKMRVTIPCWMGGVSGNITTDVVDCKIPLLLSRKSMKRVGMLLDFTRDEVIVNGHPIELKVTTSGHYALPISL